MILSNINSSANKRLFTSISCQDGATGPRLNSPTHYTDSCHRSLRHAGGMGCLGGALWGQGL